MLLIKNIRNTEIREIVVVDQRERASGAPRHAGLIAFANNNFTILESLNKSHNFDYVTLKKIREMLGFL